MSIHNFSVKQIGGKIVNLSEYKGKVLLIVNTASQSSFATQIKELEALYSLYKHKGLEILSFPCDQFAGEEPYNNKEILEYYTHHFGVTYTIFEKTHVNGEMANPVFNYLKENAKGLLNNEIKWNFTKFLVDKDGIAKKRFAPIVKPETIKIYIEELL